MPKVCLTDKQRAAARYNARAQRIADGLAIYKRRHGLRNRDISAALGIRPESVARILKADRTLRLDMETMFRLEEIANDVPSGEEEQRRSAV